ncbi:MAG: hypothetical protein HKN20_13220, partial [Gemmatimonadetes bacterium]|nr:hypothetical protein [Gemmatimonadota bacterium]
LDETTVESGERRVEWDGTNDRGDRVASGTYFVKMKSQGFSETRKVVLVR